MFKLQNKIQSMDVNKNTESYKFNPGHRGFINSKYRISKTFDKYANTENKKINIRDNLFNKMYQIPPVFFYRKVSNPYKYSMTAVPEYLIKTNEEKHFIILLNFPYYFVKLWKINFVKQSLIAIKK